MKIILDCDPGIDDIFAIMLACKSKEIEIKGISTVDGNCSLENTIRNSFKTLDILDRNDILIYKGMDKALDDRKIDATEVHGANGIGGLQIEDPIRSVENENAVDYLIRETKENKGEIILVAVGPLTNIACAVIKDEEFVKNVKQLVIMGGSEQHGNITEFAEFNFYKDPKAAQIVFEAGFKDIIMVGLDVTQKLPMLNEFEVLLNNMDDKTARFLYDISRIAAVFDRSQGFAGYILNDPLTIAYLIDNSILKLKDSYVSIETEGEQIGKSYVNNGEQNCRVAYKVDVKKFYQILFGRLFPEKFAEFEKIISGIGDY